MSTPPEDELIEAAMAAFKVNLSQALVELRAARCPSCFAAGERREHELAQSVASQMTQMVVQEMCDDPKVQEQAADLVREKASKRGVKMRRERPSTDTPVVIPEPEPEPAPKAAPVEEPAPAPEPPRATVIEEAPPRARVIEEAPPRARPVAE